MKETSLKLPKPDIVVPEEAAGRGSFIRGELRSADDRYPEMLAQFEHIPPHKRKSRIHLFPTAEQAKRLFHAFQGPFTFEGTFCTLEDVMETYLAEDIWLKPTTQIAHKEATYWSQTSGQIGTLETKTRYLSDIQLASREDQYPAWFIARPCFALQVLVNQSEEEEAESIKYGFSKPDVFLTLSDDASIYVRRYVRSQRKGPNEEITRNGYSIHMNGYKDPKQAKRDVDVFLLLASFASRQRTVSSHWSHETREGSNRFWQFNWGKFRKRREREEPLVRRDRQECRDFLQTAFEVYSRSNHHALLDSAIYTLIGHEQTIETRIARLYSGIQGALMFGTQYQSSGKRTLVGSLFQTFSMSHPRVFDDLWPLVDRSQGVALADVRNAIVHGEAFSDMDWLALSYASEHLHWYLERIIMISLGWNIDRSSVSASALRFFYAHSDWKKERARMTQTQKKP